MILRFFLFLFLFISGVFTPFWFLIAGAVVYASLYTAYELFLLGVLIDTLYGFGSPLQIPYYTIGFCVLLLCAEWIKPHISGYNQ